MKKKLSVILLLSVLLSFLSCASFDSYAGTANGYEYDYVGDGTVFINEYKGNDDKNIIIPSVLDNYPVSGISNHAFDKTEFYNNPDNWDNGVLYIDNCLIEATRDVSGSYTIREGTRIIADEAFHATGITHIDMPDSVEIIGGMAFCDCDFTEVVIPKGVKIIGNSAFSQCESLERIIINNNVEKIGYGAFNETEFFENENNWENGLLYLNNYLIASDRELLSGVCDIKDGTSLIADGAFSYCKALNCINIPETVLYVGSGAFRGCSAIESIAFPEKVKNFGSYLFMDCISLKSVDFPKNIKKIGYGWFSHCSALESFILTDSIELIDENAFSCCSSLKSITIPENVKTISQFAFYSCDSLTEITIPDNVEEVLPCAFCACASLKKITVLGEKTYLGRASFGFEKDSRTPLDSITIYGYEGATSEKYAKDNGFTFVALEGKKVDNSKKADTGDKIPTKDKKGSKENSDSNESGGIGTYIAIGSAVAGIGIILLLLKLFVFKKH